MPAPKDNQNARGNRGGRGREPIYNSRVPGMVRALRENGATDREIADALGVSDRTLRRWRVQHIELKSALDIGNEVMLQRVKQSYFHRAIGYSYESEKIVTVGGVVERVPIIEHVPPDTGAAWNIMKNLEPEVWKDKTEVKQEQTFSLAT